MESGSEKLRISGRSIAAKQFLILKEICNNRFETITALLIRLSKESNIPLSTLKLNASKLRSLGLFSQENSKPVKLTTLGKAIFETGDKKIKTVGVLGGFGPETTAEFYMSVVNKNKRLATVHPSILIYNVPVPFELERDAVRHARNLERFLPLLVCGVKTIENMSDFIVLPCNTLHIFVEDLRKISKVPIMSIIDETAKEIKSRKISRIGLLATAKSLREGLLESKLMKQGVITIKPSEADTAKLSVIIHEILCGRKTEKLRLELFRIAQELEKMGAEAIVLGCTDLQLILKHHNFSLPLIDTMDVLAESTARAIYGDNNDNQEKRT